jgi:hypothetical protein
MSMRPDELLMPTPAGLCCPPGGFHIDPLRPVDKALITHAHSDHARAGHRHVLATRETLDLMRLRYGDDFAESAQPIAYGETVNLGDVTVSFHPAGHVLGSAQILVESCSLRIVASGDYKDVADPTCAPFVPISCDVFISEATFGLPVFRHGDPASEIAKLMHSLALFPDRAHLVGVYALGKAQRVIALLRTAGYEGADLSPWRARDDYTLLRTPVRSWRIAPSTRRAQGRACGRGHSVPAYGAERYMDAPLFRSCRLLCFRLDAHSGARPPARRRTAAGHFRSLRLGWADPSHPRHGRLRSVGDARRGRGVGALVRDARLAGATAPSGRLRRGGRG